MVHTSRMIAYECMCILLWGAATLKQPVAKPNIRVWTGPRIGSSARVAQPGVSLLRTSVVA
jgi:hypothetical protein